MKLWPFMVCCAIFLRHTFGARILALMPYSGKSHYLSIQPLVQELSNRGHDLTMVSPMSIENANYRQIITDKKRFWDYLGEPVDIFTIDNFLYHETLSLVYGGTYYTSEVAFNSTPLKDFIKNDNSHFDLILTELFYQESMYMFAHKYKAPLVGISTMGFVHHAADVMGNPIAYQYMNHEYSGFGKKMSFFQTAKNVYHNVLEMMFRRFYFLPKHQALAERSFPDLPRPLPSLIDLQKNMTVLLLNSHFSYDVAKPYLPGIVEVGGLHIKKPKPLTPDIRKFMDEAQHGVIFFSLGSNVQAKDMDKDRLNVFLNVFAKLKQRVLMKWEEDKLEGKPGNVMIGKWLPQSDILAHPNLKVFITHGGLLSTQESFYHGVPIVGIPFFGDQSLNAQKVEELGFGIKLHYLTMTEEILHDALNRIIYEPNFKKIAQELSFRFRDRPSTAMETAVYWIEYAIRHKGAPFMKSPILNEPLIAYYMLDVLAFYLLSGLILIITLLFIFIKLITCVLCRQKQQPIGDNKKYK